MGKSRSWAAPVNIRAAADRAGLQLDGIQIVDPLSSPRVNSYAEIYFERRHARGLTHEEAQEFARKPLYFAALSVAAGDADSTVGGAANSTSDTVRAALHSIGLAPDARIMSSFFLMIATGTESHRVRRQGSATFRRLRRRSRSNRAGAGRNRTGHGRKCPCFPRDRTTRRASLIFDQRLCLARSRRKDPRGVAYRQSPPARPCNRWRTASRRRPCRLDRRKQSSRLARRRPRECFDLS